MKKIIKSTGIILTLFALLFSLCGCGGYGARDLRNYICTPLCAHASEPNLTVDRDTNIHIYRRSNGSGVAEIAEIFTVYNDGEETTVALIYPVLADNIYPEDVDFRINGEPSTDWWGAANANEVLEILYRDKGMEKLNDGTFFNRAFPNWPALGEQVHNIDSDPEENWSTDLCGISYYVKEVTIPANESVTVTASFEGRGVSILRFFRLADEITCTHHTLSVSVDPHSGNEDIGIEDQNVIDELPDSDTWTVELDPAREDYFITVEDD